MVISTNTPTVSTRLGSGGLRGRESGGPDGCKPSRKEEWRPASPSVHATRYDSRRDGLGGAARVAGSLTNHERQLVTARHQGYPGAWRCKRLSEVLAACTRTSVTENTEYGVEIQILFFTPPF